MISIVKGVEKVFVEGVDILEARETVEYGLKLFAKGLGCEFDFARVETCRNSCQLRLPDARNYFALLILLILKPARICVGSRL